MLLSNTSASRKLLLAIFAFVINQKGLPALALRRIIGTQYRTCYLVLAKIREALVGTVPDEQLSGIVEIDGGHFSGRIRKGRKTKRGKGGKKEVPAKYRQHRAKVPPSRPNKHPNRRIIMTLREISPETTGEFTRWGNKPIGKGARRTLVAVCMTENNIDAEALIRKHVAPCSVIRTDEWRAYGNVKKMGLGYIHQVVNHTFEFSSDEGYNENQAESLFSRLRRANIGVYHRITPRYMLDYATEAAWREDARRLDTLGQFKDLFGRLVAAGLSRDFLNYCRKGFKRKVELLFRATAPGCLDPLPAPN